MSRLANEMSVMGQLSCPKGGLGACPQQVKKGRSPLLRRSFFGEFGTKLHTCTSKNSSNEKIINQINKGNQNETN